MPQPRRLNHAGGPLSLDADLGDVAVMLSGSVTPLTVDNLSPRESLRAIFIQDAVGGHAVTWPAWSFAAGPPAVDPAPGAITAVVIASLAAGPRAWTTDFGSLEIATAVLLADDPAAVDASTIALINTRVSKAANLSDITDPVAARVNLAAAPLASPAFTGNPTAPTPGAGDDDASLATTAFVQAAVSIMASRAANLSDLADAVAARGNLGAAPLASPAFVGAPTAPTAPPGTNTTQLATTQFVEAINVALASAVSLGAAKAANLSDLADAPIARKNLAIPGRNYVDNPSFDVWQAGASLSLPASSDTFLADGWKARRQATTGITISRQLGFASAPYCLRVQRASGDASINTVNVAHQIETLVATRLQGKSIVLSFDVRSGADYSNASSALAVGLFIGTGADEPFSLNPGTFPTGSVGLHSAFYPTSTTLSRVSTPPTSVPVDATELAIRFTYTPTGIAGAADYFEITNVKLEVGVATPFEAPDPAVTMAACQRRYRKSFAQATAPATSVGVGTGERRCPAPLAGAAMQRLGMVQFGAPMRAVPTVTLYNPAAANGQVRDLTAGADCSATAAANVSDGGFEVTCTGAASTAAGGDLAFHWTADARL